MKEATTAACNSSIVLPQFLDTFSLKPPTKSCLESLDLGYMVAMVEKLWCRRFSKAFHESCLCLSNYLARVAFSCTQTQATNCSSTPTTCVCMLANLLTSMSASHCYHIPQWGVVEGREGGARNFRELKQFSGHSVQYLILGDL